MSNSLWPHGLQHARLPCLSTSARVYSNSCPLSRWYHPTISSIVIPFSSRLQSFPASGYFPMNQFFTSGAKELELQLLHQSFQWIFSTDFPLDRLVGSPCSPRDSQESSPIPQFKSINSSTLSFLEQDKKCPLHYLHSRLHSWLIAFIAKPQKFSGRELPSWLTVTFFLVGGQVRKKGKIPAPLGSTPQLCSYPLREYEHVPSTFRVLISSTRKMEISDFSNKALTEVLLANGTDTYGFTKNR